MDTCPPAAGLPRRRFLLATGGLALAAACSGGESSSDSTGNSVSSGDASDGTVFLQSLFADGVRAPTSLATGLGTRAVFGLADADGLPMVNGVPATIEGTLTTPEGTTSSVVLPERSAGLAAAHYPLVFDATEEGSYTLDVTVAGQDQQTQFVVGNPADLGLVQVGDPLRSVATPTVDDARGVDPICTRFEPCPFHEVSLDMVLDNGRPTVLMIATPGFCQTVSCGPVVDLLIELNPEATADVIHAEVYTDPQQLTAEGPTPDLLAPVVSAYNLAFEPSLLVAAADGTVTARLDYSFDRDEIAEALATLG